MLQHAEVTKVKIGNKVTSDKFEVSKITVKCILIDVRPGILVLIDVIDKIVRPSS